MRGPRAGFTLVEVLVALMIVATTIGALQLVASGALKSAVETNRLRAAKMLLMLKAGEVVAGLEEGQEGGFEGYPGFSWSVSEQLVALDDSEEQVRLVSVAVRYPTLRVAPGAAPSAEPDDEVADGPGQISISVLLDPADAKLEPPPAVQTQSP